jgi:glycosyltransferase involved in cell wall biosynthesis
MKIVQITTDNREHERDYAASVPRFGTAPEALLQGFAELPEVEVHVVSCLKQAVISPERIAPNIFYHPVVVPQWGWLKSWYYGCSRAVRKKIAEIKPDIVHGQGTERDCAISAVRSGFPNVLTIHGNMKAIAQIFGARPGSFHWFAEKLETAAFKQTAGVFCNSAYTEALVASRAKKTWRVPNALRPGFFAPLPFPPKNPVPVILNIGVADARKRQREILAAARRLHERGLKFELNFIGHVPDTEYGSSFSRELKTAAAFARHRGLLGASQLIAAMDAADAVIHFPTEEAFGLVVAEALARNLKFFGAATGGIVDIASGVEGAELFAADDFPGMEKALAVWINAGGRHLENASKLMTNRYHPEVVARRHLEIYREVLGQTGRR